ncbi:MAG: protoporphyrinogen oxidase [Candidatus Kapabacteria bacterium]|nr:protoporphyrinogen oxidase [Candidatus Kapabacteria bacterium]
MPIEINTEFVIIGAGLTGLSCAHFLKKAGKTVVLIEKNNRVGGVINTIFEEGFVFETGPNSGVIAHPEVFTLFDDLRESSQLETARKESKRRLIWKNKKWEALPSGLISAIHTPLFSLKDKFRILGEPFRAKGTDPDESVADLVLRRLGKSFLNYAVDPFISGIYAGNPANITTRFALPKLYELEQNYGSFIKGSFKKKPVKLADGEKKATREVFSANGGLLNIISSLENSINKNNIFLNSANIHINNINGEFISSFSQFNEEVVIKSRKVITTIGGYALPDILSFIEKKELKPITDLEYAKVVQVALGFKNWQGIELNAFGGLVPSIENRKILGVLFCSSIFTGRSPIGGALLSVFIGGMRNPQAINLSDDEIQSLVLSELSEMCGLKNPKPDLIRIFRYPNAIPQYSASTGARLAKIKELETKFPGLILAGNIRDGIGMADRIKQGKKIAELF